VAERTKESWMVVAGVRTEAGTGLGKARVLRVLGRGQTSHGLVLVK